MALLSNRTPSGCAFRIRSAIGRKIDIRLRGERFRDNHLTADFLKRLREIFKPGFRKGPVGKIVHHRDIFSGFKDVTT